MAFAGNLSPNSTSISALGYLSSIGAHAQFRVVVDSRRSLSEERFDGKSTPVAHSALPHV